MAIKGASMPIFTVDAFTSTAFSGNPAAVCLPGNQELTEERMLQIASEMNLSETAFISLVNPSDSYETSADFGLRWFTPTHEVNLCGHATLASASVLFNCIGNKSHGLAFRTLSGTLLASRRSRDDDVISLDFPLNKPRLVDTRELQDVVNNTIKLVCGDAKVDVVDIQYSASTRKLLLRIQDSPQPKDLLQLLEPNFAEMSQQDPSFVRGVIVTCKSSFVSEGDVVDFYSRYFSPWVGINEDPVTGSAHTVLTPYWASILGKTKFNAVQCSKRGGKLEVECVEGDRCVLRGKTVVVLEGKISNPS